MQMDEISNPITVYGPVHADVAAHIAREMGTPLFLLSAAGAAAYMGPAWFLALIRQTQERFPEADIRGALDCGGLCRLCARRLTARCEDHHLQRSG